MSVETRTECRIELLPDRTVRVWLGHGGLWLLLDLHGLAANEYLVAVSLLRADPIEALRVAGRMPTLVHGVPPDTALPAHDPELVMDASMRDMNRIDDFIFVHSRAEMLRMGVPALILDVTRRLADLGYWTDPEAVQSVCRGFWEWAANEEALRIAESLAEADPSLTERELVAATARELLRRGVGPTSAARKFAADGVRRYLARSE
ncbi:MAG: hypothetical protein ACK41F_11065 [Fimbriimonadaceae bacterium]